MTLSLSSKRFETEHGFEVSVQVPNVHEEPLLDAISQIDALQYGDYDRVSFVSACGLQRFRSLPGGRNAASENVLDVPCEVLSFFIGNEDRVAVVVQNIYEHHPYEEPVVLIQPTYRTLHRAGLDEDNQTNSGTASRKIGCPKSIEIKLGKRRHERSGRLPSEVWSVCAGLDD